MGIYDDLEHIGGFQVGDVVHGGKLLGVVKITALKCTIWEYGDQVRNKDYFDVITPSGTECSISGESGAVCFTRIDNPLTILILFGDA